MSPPKKQKKNPFDDLPADWKESVEAADDTAVRMSIVKAAMDDEDLRKAQEGDEDLAEKKEATKFANEPYSSGFKMNRLKIKYAKQLLESRGKA